MPPINTFFQHDRPSEQNLLEELVIESLQIYGQDMLYLPRTAISTDEILNEEYSKFEDAYSVEMYILNPDAFEGEGKLLSKFGFDIKDQATFVVSKRRFAQLVAIRENQIAHQRPREGDLIYLPLSNSLFEIRFVENERPFYQLASLPTYQLQCELYDYGSERFDTGVTEVDQFESLFANQLVLKIEGGDSGFRAGEKIQQNIADGVSIFGEVSNFVEIREGDPTVPQTRVANLYTTGIFASDGSKKQFVNTDNSTTFKVSSIDNPAKSGWDIVKVYNVSDPEMGVPTEPLAQNESFESEAEDIISWDESNPFGEPRVRPNPDNST